MIEQAQLPSWREIFLRIGETPPRHGRARCPIHNGDSPTSLSVKEDRGDFHCFVCGAKGDKVAFVQQVLGCDFKDALRWLGLEAGKPPKPDPAATRQRLAMQAVRDWCERTGRRLRDEFYLRQRILRHANEKLHADPENETGWQLLRNAYNGEAENEFLLDEIDLFRTHDERIRAWRKYRNV